LFIISIGVFSFIVTKLFGVSSSTYFWMISIATGISVVAGALIAPPRFQRKAVYVLMAILVIFTIGGLVFDVALGKATAQNIGDIAGVALGFVLLVRPLLKRMPITRTAKAS
jgi:hypothetical protein